MTNTEATKQLIQAGATHEKKETEQGETKSGWWLDTVWLAPYSKPQDALRALNG